MPFRKFTQRGFLDYGQDPSRMKFAPALWKRSTEEDTKRLHSTSQQTPNRLDAFIRPASILMRDRRYDMETPCIQLHFVAYRLESLGI
jgi:hypothetical protein